ncbi:unnamed protein product [Meganyctiphanes norvegica]|uniref:Uncharacterized protein n=1 Tax=Meganyctiphanes norvegica TaxID=48144 RepID=A0AAV2Q8X6_MEGNR
MYKVVCSSTSPKTGKFSSVPRITMSSREVEVVSLQNKSFSKLTYITSHSKQLPYITITTSKALKPPHGHNTRGNVAFITLTSSKTSPGLLSEFLAPCVSSNTDTLYQDSCSAAGKDLDNVKQRQCLVYLPFFK